MDCREAADLLAAYALDALDEAEREAVAAHLAGCGLHGELRGLRAVAASLALAAPEMEPPAGLERRILAAVAGEPAPPIPLRRPNRRTGITPWALAAGLAVISLGLLAWNLALQLGDEEPASGVVVLDFAGAVGSGQVIRVDGEQVVVFLELEPPPAGQTYQLWLVHADAVTSAGVVALDAGGTAAVAITENLATAVAVAVSVEPEGGSAQPTSEPVLAVEL
jgi:anti-sigma-K factor RskA